MMLMMSTVQNDAAGLAVDVFLNTIERANQGELDPDLLQVMKLRYAQEYVLDQQTTLQMMDRLMEPVDYGDSWDHLTQIPQRLSAVGIPDIRQQVANCVGHEVVLLMGPKEIVIHQLEEHEYSYELFDWEAETDRLFKEHDPKGWAKEQKRKAKAEKKNKKAE